MGIELFLTLLAICSVLTGLFTEAFKKVFKNAHPNLLAGIIAVVIGIATCVCYVLLKSVPITTPLIIYGILLVIFSWLCAMVGYDKVVQTIKQLAGKE